MRRNQLITTEQIAPDMLETAYREKPGHATLGAEITASPEDILTPSPMPIGSKAFIVHEAPALRDDPGHDSVGLFLGIDPQTTKLKFLTLAPKDGGPWGIHTAYGDKASEIPDALAALDRLFDPKQEFGSVAVLSATTGVLLGGHAPNTIAEAGCGSHEAAQLPATLNLSQLLDNYRWRPLMVSASRLRHDSEGQIIHLLPGQKHEDQPSIELRDQRGMLDRINRLATDPRSTLNGLGAAAILQGIETAVSRNLANQEQSLRSTAQLIELNAQRIR